MNLKVQPGDRITAAGWNSVVDRLPGRRFASAANTPDSLLSIKVLAENSTGAALTLGDVGKLGTYQGPAGAHEQLNQPLYTVTAATLPGVLASPAIAAEDIPSGEIGLFVVSGLAAVKFSSTSGDGGWAEIDTATPSQVTRSASGIGRVVNAASPVGQILLQADLPTAAIAMSPSGGIPARSGTTSGSATVTLYTNTGGTLAATSPAITVTAYNLSLSAVAGSTYIHLKREYLSGTWLVDFEDCG